MSHDNAGKTAAPNPLQRLSETQKIALDDSFSTVQSFTANYRTALGELLQTLVDDAKRVEPRDQIEHILHRLYVFLSTCPVPTIIVLRFLQLVFAFADLDEGKVDLLLKPAKKVGRRSHIKEVYWADLATAVIAFYMKDGLSLDESCKAISKTLKGRGAKVSPTELKSCYRQRNSRAAPGRFTSLSPRSAEEAEGFVMYLAEIQQYRLQREAE